jgi:riboflavin synthase
MFTGIIEATATVARLDPKGGGAGVTIETTRPLPKLVLGESIAVNGACLTVTGFRGRRFTVDVSPETLRRTTPRRPSPARPRQLERALRMGDRLGGHLVQGT